MFARMIDDLKQSTGSALRLTSLAAAAALALFVTTSFLCAAAFVFVLERYGPVQACLAGAAVGDEGDVPDLVGRGRLHQSSSLCAAGRGRPRGDRKSVV